MPSNLRESYRKAVKVIESCENLIHIEAARKYINLLFKLYSVESRASWGRRSIRVADDILVKKYKKLYEKIDEKQIFLSN